MKRLFIAIASILVTAHSAQAGELFSKNEPLPFEIGQTVKNTDTIGGYPVWDNGGKWRLLHLSVGYSTGRAMPAPLGSSYWIESKDKKMISGMLVTANLTPNLSADWTDEPCKRDDFLFKKNLKGLHENINCVSINHLVGFMVSPTGIYQSVLGVARDNGIEIPPTVLLVSVTRYHNNGRRYVAQIAINPEADGFERATEPLWTLSPWHKSKAMNDPVKRAYIDSLSIWAEQFAMRVEKAFEKDASAFSGFGSWRGAQISSAQQARHIKPTFD